MKDNPELQIFIDILIASVLAMIVGIEREKANKAAGIRTNMIVSGFTCLIISIQPRLINYIQASFPDNMIDIDPIRVLQAVIVGLSFIGAGTIIKSPDQKHVTGLTTAATLLYSLGIGICVSIHYYLLAVCLTIFILVINFLLNYITKKYTDLKD